MTTVQPNPSSFSDEQAKHGGASAGPAPGAAHPEKCEQSLTGCGVTKSAANEPAGHMTLRVRAMFEPRGGPRSVVRVSGAQYGSEIFETASHYLQGVASNSGRARLGHTVRPRGFIASLRLMARLECLTVSPTDSPSGRAIRAYLEERRHGIPTHRIAQGVLVVPRSRQVYLRGHHKQAVRTNLHRARDELLSCTQLTSFAEREAVIELMGAEFDDWWRKALLNHPDSAWWAVFDAERRPIGIGVVSIDSEVALLWALVCRRSSSARWLLHTEIVSEMVERGVQWLITGASMAPVMSPGSQYFQRLLGYKVAHLRLGY